MAVAATSSGRLAVAAVGEAAAAVRRLRPLAVPVPQLPPVWRASELPQCQGYTPSVDRQHGKGLTSGGRVEGLQHQPRISPRDVAVSAPVVPTTPAALPVVHTPPHTPGAPAHVRPCVVLAATLSGSLGFPAAVRYAMQGGDEERRLADVARPALFHWLCCHAGRQRRGEEADC